jgi:hypothetical protein
VKACHKVLVPSPSRRKSLAGEPRKIVTNTLQVLREKQEEIFSFNYRQKRASCEGGNADWWFLGSLNSG